MIKQEGRKKPIFLNIKKKNIEEITLEWVNENI